MDINIPNLLTLNEAATILKVHPNTLRYWDKNGTLPSVRIGQRKTRRYRKDTVLSFMSLAPSNVTDPEERMRYFASVVDSMNEAVIGRDMNGTIITWNKAAEKLYGYAALDVIGKQISIIFPDTDKGMWEEHKKVIMQAKVVEQYETKKVTKTGELIDVVLSLYPIRDEKGVIIGAYSLSRDISKQKQAEEQIFSYTYLIEHISDAVISLSPDGRILTWNKAAENLYGYTREEVCNNKPADDLIQQLFGLGKRVTIIQQVQKKGYWKGELQQRTKNAKQITVSCSVSDIKNSRGEVIGFLAIHKDITKQKQITKQLEVEKSKLENLFDQSPALMAVFRGKDFIIERVNESCRKAMGTYRDYVGKTAQEATPEIKEQPQYLSLLRSVYETGKPYFNRGMKAYLQDTKNGPRTEKYFDNLYQPIREVDGSISGVLMHSFDVTEQYHLMKELKAEREKYKDIAENLPSLVWVAEQDGNVIYLNKRINEFTGFSAYQGKGWDWKRAIHPEDWDDTATRWQTALKNGTVYEAEQRVRKADGSYRWMLSRAVPLYDSNNTIQKWFGTITDINAQKEIQEALRKSHEQLQALANSNIIGVMYGDMSGTVFDVNDAFLKMTGFTRTDVKKGIINWKKLTPPNRGHNMQDERAWKEMLSKGYVVPWEKEYYRKDGSIVPILIGGALLDKQKTEAVVFVLDMTKQKELEQRKDEFVSLVCHELRTPLASIKGYSQILERAIRNEDVALVTHTLIEKQLSSVNTLAALISDLLDVSRIQSQSFSYKYSFFEVSKLITETIEIVCNTHKSCSVRNNSKADNTKLYADRIRIQQVLINILNNAVKYSRHGKEIVITTIIEKDTVILSVQDFGIGIPLHEQERLFERFYRAKNTMERYSGLGIGLYLSKQIVQHHGGDIWLESEEGKGSTFFVRLPVRKMRREIEE